MERRNQAGTERGRPLPLRRWRADREDEVLRLLAPGVPENR